MQPGSILTESGRAKPMRESSIINKPKVETPNSPSRFFLTLAGGVVALSLGLAMSSRRKNWATFVGLWAPLILLLGLYDKVTKITQKNKAETSSTLH